VSDDQGRPSQRDKKSVPRRHHYVARTYLAGFAGRENGEQLEVHDFAEDNAYRTSAVKAAAESHFYPPEIETYLAQNVESWVPSTIGQLRLGLDLTPPDRWAFARFLALSFTRVPRFRAWATRAQERVIHQLASAGAGPVPIDRALATSAVAFGLEPETLRAFLLSPEDAPKRDRVVKAVALPMAATVTEALYRMRWWFLRTTDDQAFLTSDNPLGYFVPALGVQNYDTVKAGFGLLHPTVEVTFPVTRRLLLLAHWPPGPTRFEPIAPDAVERLNERTVRFAQRFIYGHRTDLLARAAQYRRGS
jgi:hypothetical protein